MIGTGLKRKFLEHNKQRNVNQDTIRKYIENKDSHSTSHLKPLN